MEAFTVCFTPLNVFDNFRYFRDSNYSDADWLLLITWPILFYRQSKQKEKKMQTWSSVHPEFQQSRSVSFRSVYTMLENYKKIKKHNSVLMLLDKTSPEDSTEHLLNQNKCYAKTVCSIFTTTTLKCLLIRRRPQQCEGAASDWPRKPRRCTDLSHFPRDFQHRLQRLYSICFVTSMWSQH